MSASDDDHSDSLDSCYYCDCCEVAATDAIAATAATAGILKWSHADFHTSFLLQLVPAINYPQRTEDRPDLTDQSRSLPYCPEPTFGCLPATTATRMYIVTEDRLHIAMSVSILQKIRGHVTTGAMIVIVSMTQKGRPRWPFDRATEESTRHLVSPDDLDVLDVVEDSDQKFTNDILKFSEEGSLNDTDFCFLRESSITGTPASFKRFEGSGQQDFSEIQTHCDEGKTSATATRIIFLRRDSI
jgi:hypothetical protein